MTTPLKPKQSLLDKKSSGRPAGTQGKVALSIQEKLDKIGCDPIIGMAKIAMDESNPKDLRAKMYSELSQYVYAKRRSIENIIVEAPKQSVEELQAKVDALIKKVIVN